MLKSGALVPPRAPLELDWFSHGRTNVTKPLAASHQSDDGKLRTIFKDLPQISPPLAERPHGIPRTHAFATRKLKLVQLFGNRSSTANDY
jgi:hypothetical protein